MMAESRILGWLKNSWCLSESASRPCSHDCLALQTELHGGLELQHSSFGLPTWLGGIALHWLETRERLALPHRKSKSHLYMDG